MSPLEAALINTWIEAQELFRETLIQQVEGSRLASGELNGYGFYTNFSVPTGAPHLPWQDHRLHASAIVGGELCGFILWIEDGKISFLEGYPLGGDSWPKHETFTNVKLS
ncbi:MAG: hypothetical protein ACRYFU_10595 [Janthinobacterium lividum]